jgi:hypothetical protein
MRPWLSTGLAVSAKSSAYAKNLVFQQPARAAFEIFESDDGVLRILIRRKERLPDSLRILLAMIGTIVWPTASVMRLDHGHSGAQPS